MGRTCFSSRPTEVGNISLSQDSDTQAIPVCQVIKYEPSIASSFSSSISLLDYEAIDKCVQLKVRVHNESADATSPRYRTAMANRCEVRGTFGCEALGNPNALRWCNARPVQGSACPASCFGSCQDDCGNAPLARERAISTRHNHLHTANTNLPKLRLTKHRDTNSCMPA